MWPNFGGADRTILIDPEEQIKLSIYQNAASWEQRKEIEELFWKAEDHNFFEGEIIFFLNRYYDSHSRKMDIESFKKTWQVFEDLFSGKISQNKIAMALMYFGYTWVRNSPYYYENYNCRNWYEIVRLENASPLLDLLEELRAGATLNKIIRVRMQKYFTSNGLSTIEDLKKESQFYNQVKILAAIDYYAERKMFGPSDGYISKDNRYAYGDPPFFNNNPDLFNVSRYINDGDEGRLMNILKQILQNNDKLIFIVNSIRRGS